MGQNHQNGAKNRKHGTSFDSKPAKPGDRHPDHQSARTGGQNQQQAQQPQKNDQKSGSQRQYGDDAGGL